MNMFDIPVEVSLPPSGMAKAIFHELYQHLQQFEKHGHTHTIDVLSLPLNAADKAELEQLLGEGEITVQLDSIGESRIFETAFSGIWWVRHFTEEQRLVAEYIEVCSIPEIVRSHPADVKLASDRMKQIIAQDE